MGANSPWGETGIVRTGDPGISRGARLADFVILFSVIT